MSFDAEVKILIEGGYVHIIVRPEGDNAGFQRQLIEMTEEEFKKACSGEVLDNICVDVR